MSVKSVRTGRRNPHTLYLQVGAEPSDYDIPLGFVVSRDAAIELAALASSGIACAEQMGGPVEPHHFGFPARL